ncbi:MAG: tetratricopeptide repeat protein, partial [Muribaculaceae bacterium]|nr:tetratricopeptide repeat protein [Muribaculaceae bacterium]
LQEINANTLEAGAAGDLTYRKAFCLMKLGRYDEAAALFDSVASSKKYDTAAKFYGAYCAYAIGDYASAEKQFAQLTACPTEPACNSTYYLAQIAYSKGDFDKTLSLIRPMLRRADADPALADEARRLAGESLFALGRESEGADMLRNYMADHAADAPASTRYVLGVDSYRHGKYEDAIELLGSPLFERNAMGQNAALFLGLSQLARGNNSAAILAFQRAIDFDFDADATETAFYNYAVARVEGGRVPFGNSISTLEEFIQRYPRSKYAPTVQEYLVNGYIGADNYEAALRSINSVRRPSAAVLAAKQRVHFVLGTRAYSSGRYADAEKHFREAATLASNSADIDRQNTLWLGDALYAQGRYADAEKQYRTYLTRAPRNDANIPVATYNLGYALFGARDYDAARERLAIAAKAPALGSAIRADAYNRIGDTYYYQSKFTQALDNYRLAHDTDPATGDYATLQEAMMLGLLGKQKEKI